MIKDNRSSIESDLNRHHVRYEDPLWSEERELSIAKMISIRVNYDKKDPSEKACEWNIFVSKKLVLTISGQNLSKKQARFLQTPEGLQFLLQKYKSGCNSVSKLKAELKTIQC